MANNYILKDFDGGAQKTTLTAALTSSATSFSVVDGSSYPPGSSPFVVVIDRGLATEEKILISSRVGNSFSALERAYDGSSAQTHALGAVVEHVLDAYTIEQANRYVNLQSAKGDLVAHDGTTTQKIGVGANDTVLVADSAQTSGIKWGQIEAGSISSGAIAAIAAQVEALITPSGVPTGTIVQFAGTTAPTGWLLCRGQVLQTTGQYAALFDVLEYRYGGSGSSFHLPDLQKRVPVGLDVNNPADTNFSQLGQVGGQVNTTLQASDLPGHSHTVSGNAALGGTHSHDTTSNGNPLYQPGIMLRSTHATQNTVTGGYTFTTGATGVTLGVGSTNDAPEHTHTVSGTATSTNANQTTLNNLQPYQVLNYIIKI